MKHVVTIIIAILVGGDACAQHVSMVKDCSQTSVPGLTALPELGTGYYIDPFGVQHQGGLYPGGMNQAPAAHAASAMQEASAIQPLDHLGNPAAASGRIGVIGIGHSVARQTFDGWREEFSEFDPGRNQAVVLVDGTTDGTSAGDWAQSHSPQNPNSLWTNALDRVKATGLSANQVQVAFVLVYSDSAATFPLNAVGLRNDLEDIAVTLRSVFPNCRIAYLTSAHYLGFTVSTNPGRCEPCGYEQGFATKWVIARQIAGQGNLNFDSTNPPVVAPLLLWGPYLWANGEHPTGSNHFWVCDDYQDGVHFSPQGRTKAAALLDFFFLNHPTTTPWYLPGSGPVSPPAVALATQFGSGCRGLADKLPRIDTTTDIGGGFHESAVPWIGNGTFRIELLYTPVDCGSPGCPNPPQPVLLLGSQLLDPLPRECVPAIDTPLSINATFGGPNGNLAGVLYPIPDNPALQGFVFYGQWVIDECGELALSQPTRFRCGAR